MNVQVISLLCFLGSKQASTAFQQPQYGTRAPDAPCLESQLLLQRLEIDRHPNMIFPLFLILPSCIYHRLAVVLSSSNFASLIVEC